MALAGKRVDTVDAITMMTRRALAVVNINFAVESSESLWTVASVTGNRIATSATVLARPAHTVVNVNVTLFAGETRRADALVAIDHVGTNSAIDARV